MKTLKEISASNPSTYRVIDLQVKNGDVKDWSDKIEIIINGKSKFCTRRNAYKFGLTEPA
jgi:hypothetical protein